MVLFCVLFFMTVATPGKADAHDALAVQVVVFVLDDDRQDELMRMMLEPWPGGPSQTPGHQARTSGCS